MACLRPSYTGLKMPVFIPTGVVYKYYREQPVMLVKADYGLENPYDGAQSEIPKSTASWCGSLADKLPAEPPGCFFQLSLKAQPELIGGPGNILAEDVEQAKIFLQRNLDYLLKMWNHELRYGEEPPSKA